MKSSVKITHIIFIAIIFSALAVLLFKYSRDLNNTVDYFSGNNDLEGVYMIALERFESNNWNELYGKERLKTKNQFLYAPLVINYFKGIKDCPRKKHYVLLLLSAFLTYVMMLCFFKTNFINSILLLFIVVFGTWKGLFFSITTFNITMFEMVFLWAGILAVLRKNILLSQFLFLLAGMFKFHWWAMGAVYLLLDKNRIKYTISYVMMIGVFFLTNLLLYQEGTLLWLELLKTYSNISMFEARNPFPGINIIFGVFWGVLSLVTFVIWYLISKNHRDLKVPLILLVFVTVNLLPRFNPYQFIYLAPVLYYVFVRINSKEKAFLVTVIPFITYSWNIYLITVYCWLILCYLFVLEIRANEKFMLMFSRIFDRIKKINCPGSPGKKQKGAS